MSLRDRFFPAPAPASPDARAEAHAAQALTAHRGRKSAQSAPRAAKTLAAAPALVESGAVARGARVLFIHTGGLSALFAYETMVREAVGGPS